MNNIIRLRDALTNQGTRIVTNEAEFSKSLTDVGDYKMSARSNDYNGWLLCNGRALSCTEYPDLYEVIGTSFGEGASNMFFLPDFSGRVLGQPGTGSNLTERVLGEAIGSETHTLTQSELPPHTHSGTTASNGDHTHTATVSSAGAHTHGVTDPGHTHTQTTTNDDFNSSGDNPPSFAADSAGTRTWNNISSATTGISIQSGGAHTHSTTLNTTGLHAHTFVTSSIGSGMAHSIMQPTLFGVHVFIYAGTPQES